MNTIELLKYIVPPTEPKSVGSPEEWKQTELQWGTKFPSDYTWYVEHYGEGAIDELVILTPFTRKRSRRLDSSLDAKAGSLLKDLREFHQTERQDFPFPAFPESGGLLPWAFRGGRVTLYWLTVGPPGAWKVVLEDLRGDANTKVFDETMTSFLIGILSGRFNHSAFEDLPQQVPIELQV